MKIRKAALSDRDAIKALYEHVAAIPGGLARLSHEISDSYIEHIMAMAAHRGIEFVACSTATEIIGEIHAFTLSQYCFSHVLSDLTILVHPSHQRKGIGRHLFAALIENVTIHMPHILRIELIARQSNLGAIKLYQSLGFRPEGEMRERIRNVDGTFESDIPMAWIRA